MNEENEAVIKALNMFGRVPEQYELLEEIERLKIIEEKYKDSQLYIHDFKEEIERLNNIINEVKQQLLNKKDIVEKSKYFKLVYYTDWNMEHEWDKSIVDKIDEIINIIDEENK